MTIARTIVIVGGGLAGAKAAEGARSAGFDGRIVLVGAEPHLPYERPPLSKSVLRGEAEPDSTTVGGPAFYDEHEVEAVTGHAVVGLDAKARLVQLARGTSIRFDAAVLATGARPRQLDVPGADLDGVYYLRTVDDSLRLRQAIRSAGRVAVIGAGWIGTEVAASARQMGVGVVLIDPAEVPLQRVLGSEVGGVFRQLHADNGVDLRLGSGAAELRGSGTVEQIILTDGRVEAADVVVVGIGVDPRVDLAIDAGLRVEDGVVVGQFLEASSPDVYAAGDVANAFHPFYGRHLRVEHWANALNQGLAAGRNAAGAGETYELLPYFFSDQYDLGMEYVGYASPDDQVAIRGDLGERQFIAFWHRDNIVTAAMNVNVWNVVDDLKTIIANRRAIDVGNLINPTLPVASLA